LLPAGPCEEAATLAETVERTSPIFGRMDVVSVGWAKTVTAEIPVKRMNSKIDFFMCGGFLRKMGKFNGLCNYFILILLIYWLKSLLFHPPNFSLKTACANGFNVYLCPPLKKLRLFKLLWLQILLQITYPR